MLTPAGRHTNEPPDHTALFSAENLLSSAGMIVVNRRRVLVLMTPSSAKDDASLPLLP